MVHYPPMKDLTIGDVGLLENKLFKRQDHLSALTGLTVKHRLSKLSAQTDNRFYLATEGKTEVRSLAKGDAGLAHAGLEINLQKENAIFFSATDIRIHEIENQILLGQKILELYKAGIWQRQWVLVTAVYIAKSTLIFGSAKGGASIVLEAETDVPRLDLADVQLQLRIKRQDTLEMNIMDNSENVCLLETSSVKRKGAWPFRKPSFGFSESDGPTDEQVLDHIRRGEKNVEDFFAFTKN